MSALHVALTGAPSFSGYWIARELAHAGFAVSALCSQAKASYSGLRGERVHALARLPLSVEYGIRAEDGSMAAWIGEHRPQVWIHHHHFMPEFRSPHYDLQNAERIGLVPLPGILDALAEARTLGVIYSGTFFEPGEGGQAADAAVTPYAQSKARVWRTLEEGCQARRLLLSKCVFSNPIGPGENEDRLLPLFLKAARERVPFSLGAPLSVGDQLPIEGLAREFVRLTQEMQSGQSRVARPSGWQGDLRSWLAKVNQEFVVGELKLPPVVIQEGTARPSDFRNPADEAVSTDWSHFWKTYAAWVSGGYAAL